MHCLSSFASNTIKDYLLPAKNATVNGCKLLATRAKTAAIANRFLTIALIGITASLVALKFTAVPISVIVAGLVGSFLFLSVSSLTVTAITATIGVASQISRTATAILFSCIRSVLKKRSRPEGDVSKPECYNQKIKIAEAKILDATKKKEAALKTIKEIEEKSELKTEQKISDLASATNNLEIVEGEVSKAINEHENAVNERIQYQHEIEYVMELIIDRVAGKRKVLRTPAVINERVKKLNVAEKALEAANKIIQAGTEEQVALAKRKVEVLQNKVAEMKKRLNDTLSKEQSALKTLEWKSDFSEASPKEQMTLDEKRHILSHFYTPLMNFSNHKLSFLQLLSELEKDD